MQISQWTTESIVISVIIAVACCVIGYFVAALRHGNRLGQLTSQLGQAQQAQVDHIPLGRFGIPAEIADAILFLCTRSASYCTGSAFVVDGGYSVQ